MTTTYILLFALTELALALTPGPAVLLIISQGMRSGSRASLLGSMGVISGNVTYFGISALGLGAVLLTSSALFEIIRWSGAVYLIYLGLKLIRETLIPQQSKPDDREPSREQRHYRQGLITQLANPKAILYFTALLPQFVDTQAAPAAQFLILGVISVIIEFPILVGYGWVANKGGQWFRQSRYLSWLDRVAGTVLIGAGVKLAFTR